MVELSLTLFSMIYLKIFSFMWSA